MIKIFQLFTLTSLLATTGFAQTATNKLESTGDVGIATTAPGKQLEIRQLAGSNKGILISGDEYYQTGHTDANGVLLLLGVNRAGNRQLWIGDNTALGSSTNGFFRYESGVPLPTVDGISGDGETRLNVNLGTTTSNVGVGFEYSGVTGTAMPLSRLTINGNSSIGTGYIGTVAPSNGLIVQGKVGIGTTSPQSELSVNGTIMATKLQIKQSIAATKVKIMQTGWADYVFHPSYRLRPLKEVERFIQANKHLPDVPSAKEVEERGLDIGENQAVLLKKIEELTLYLLELKKQVDRQQKELAELKKQ